MMYRSTHHSTTGISPAELLFRRRIRTKLPQLQEFTVEYEVRSRDSERKEKGKVYADCKRNAHETKIQRCDKVLLSTTYKQSPFTVVQKNGNIVLVEADGIQYRPNLTHVKKDLVRDIVPQTTSKSSDTTEAQGVTQGSPNQQFGESVKVPAGTTGVQTIR